jgi:hypothetical protein
VAVEPDARGRAVSLQKPIPVRLGTGTMRQSLNADHAAESLSARNRMDHANVTIGDSVRTPFQANISRSRIDTNIHAIDVTTLIVDSAVQVYQERLPGLMQLGKVGIFRLVNVEW